MTGTVASTEPQTVDGFIKSRLDAGERDERKITAQLLSASRKHLVEHIVADYVRGRRRAYVATMEHMSTGAGGVHGQSDDHRTGGSPRFGKQFGPVPLSPVEARQKLLTETVRIPGIAERVPYAKLTREMAMARIVHLESTISGLDRSARFLRCVIAALDRHGVKTFGEVPPTDEDYPQVPDHEPDGDS